MVTRASMVGLVAVLAGCLDSSDKIACQAQQDCIAGFTCLEDECVEMWSCLGTRQRRALDDDLQLNATIADEIASLPLPGAVVRVCDVSDLACASPISTTTTDADGRASFAMSDHYLEIEVAGFLPTLVMGINSLELDEDREPVPPAIDVTFDLTSIESFDSLVTAAAVTPDPTLGNIVVGAADCGFRDAPGVRFTLDAEEPGTELRYIHSDLPSITRDATDADSATAIFFNAPPNLRSVQGIVAEDGAAIGESLPVIVRPGWLVDLTVTPPGVWVHLPLD